MPVDVAHALYAADHAHTLYVAPSHSSAFSASIDPSSQSKSLRGVSRLLSLVNSFCMQHQSLGGFGPYLPVEVPARRGDAGGGEEGPAAQHLHHLDQREDRRRHLAWSDREGPQVTKACQSHQGLSVTPQKTDSGSRLWIVGAERQWRQVTGSGQSRGRSLLLVSTPWRCLDGLA
jgi:hypothetical protein